MRERLEVLRDSNKTAWEKINLTIDLYIDRLFENIDFTRVMARELSVTTRPAHCDFLVKQLHGNMQIMLSFFTEGIKNGEFKSNIDVEMTLSSIFAVIIQWINMSAIGTKLFRLSATDDVYGTAYKTRLKSHLIAMMRAHLLVHS